MLSSIKKAIAGEISLQGFQRYFFNTTWVLGEQVLRLIAGLLVGIYVARYLGPAQFGIYSYAMAFVGLFSALARMGLDGIVVRDLVLHPEKRDEYLGTAFWLKVIGALVAMSLVAIATQVMGNDETTRVYILIISGGLIFQSLDVMDFYFQSKVLSKFVAMAKMVQLGLSSLLKLYLIFIEADLIWFAVVILVDQICFVAALTLAYEGQKIGYFFRRFDAKTARTLLSNSWPLILSGIAVTLYMRIDQIMIKEMLGEREAGLYSAAVRLSEAWYFVPVAITASLFPSIVNSKQVSKKLYHEKLQKLYKFMVWMAVAVALLMTFVGNWLALLLFGPAYSESGPVFVIHIWTGVFVCFGVVFSSYLIIENKQSMINIHYAQSLVINIVLNLYFIRLIGITGAAISTLISLILSYTLVSLYSKSLRKEMTATLGSVLLLRKRDAGQSNESPEGGRSRE